MQVSVFPSSLKPSCFTIDAVMVAFVIPTQKESHHTSISVPVFIKTILLHKLPASMYLSFRRRRNHIILISVFPSSFKPSCFTINAVTLVFVIPTQEESHNASISLPVFSKTILLHKLSAGMFYLSFRRRRNHIIGVSVFPSSLKPSCFTSYRQACICHSDAGGITSY